MRSLIMLQQGTGNRRKKRSVYTLNDETVAFLEQMVSGPEPPRPASAGCWLLLYSRPVVVTQSARMNESSRFIWWSWT
jgi:hypothetical protein